MRTLLILIQKEFLQIRRNSFLPRLIVAFPILIMLIMPWITTMDVRHVGVAVIDNDRSSVSRRIISHIGATEWFTLRDGAPDYATALRQLEQGEVDVIVEIPHHFERDMILATPQPINISANSVNATKGSLGMQYVLQTIARTLRELQTERGITTSVAELAVVQNRYNPTLNYRHYMIPALMIMLLILICCFLPTLNIVGEKETGTIEQINVTPLSKLTFTLGKLIPYWIIGLFVLTVAILVARLVYGLWPAGSFGTIYLAAMLFIFTMSGFSVVLANISDTMQQAVFVMFFFVMIFVLMSGLMTPIESMPRWSQTVTMFLPPRYFIEVMRAVYLKGTTMAELWHNFAALCAFAMLFNLLAAATYKKQA
ncbi:MAG: ABC transporter permease [Muribaculaceae bacterium]|nr:ABC transporter permease [Muribaculaceae bacterium]